MKAFFVPILALFTAQAMAVGGVNMPTLEDERSLYRHFGKTWNASAEPTVVQPAPTFSISDPDIHGDTEGDDLWTSLMMYIRTGRQGYMDRANAWARYFKNDYRKCVGGNYSSFCYDRDGYGADHMWGWGLVALYEYNADAAALTEAESLAAVVEWGWSPSTFFGCLPSSGCITYGIRQIGRQLHLVTRVAEVTGKSRWITLRDRIISMLMTTSHWNSTYGMYFEGEWSTDQNLGAGAYASGDRIQSAFQIGVLAEALWHAYRVTGRDDIKNRLIAMAHFVDQYGMDSTYQYTASSFGIVDGKRWHSYSGTSGTATYWDPVYTTSVVNTLVFGFKLTGDTALFNRAFYFFDRGNKGIYGQPVQRAAADSVIHHFVDTRFYYSYYDYNKGELQYTWALFDPANLSAVEKAPRAARIGGLQAFPSPVNGTALVLRVPGAASSDLSAALYDLRGKRVAGIHTPLANETVRWNVSDLPAGVYLLRAKVAGRAMTRRVLVQK